MRSRPEIDVKLPSGVLPGETFEVVLTVTGRSVTPIDFIAVDFFVTTGTRDPANNGVFSRNELHHESANVIRKGKLREEVSRYRVELEVPAALPPTYFGSEIESRSWIEVHIAIPWWPDVRERYDVAILPEPIARPPPAAVTGSSLRGNEPFVEISLRAQSFAPGETIEGALAFGNLGKSHVQDLEAALVGYETVVDSRSASGLDASEAHRHASFLAATNAGEGREIPFRLAVPASAPPSFSLAHGSLSWMLEVRLSLGGAADVIHRIPVTIGAFEGQPRVAGAELMPIGAARWRAVWEEAGAAAGLTLDPRTLRLTGERSGCDVSVSVGKDATKRSSLVAHLRWPTWGLGLSISGGGSPARVTHFPVEAFQRRFQLGGRDREQARHALLLPLRVALLVFHEIRFGDHEAEVRSDAPGYDQPWIGTFLADVAKLAGAIDEVSRQIPPPPAMAAFVPAWQRFAGDLEAELTVGNMAITGGEFEGSAVEIRTDFDGSAPTATTIELVIDPPIDAVLDLSSPGSLQRLPAPVREILISIGTLCRPWQGADLERSPTHQVRESLISLRLPALVADPAALRDLMAALLALAAALRRDRRVGPYR